MGKEERSNLERPPGFEAYDSWLKNFILQRLRLVLWIAFIINPSFLFIDFVVTPDLVQVLFPIRMVLQLGLLMCLVLVRTRFGIRHSRLLLLMVVLIMGVSITHLTIPTGGLSSFHSNSLSFLIVGVSVLIPFRLRTHIISQALVLVYYFAANTVMSQNEIEFNKVLQNSFLIWLCVICDLSIYKYEHLQWAEFQARSDLEESNRKLLELDRLKNQFFANVSHELRTPLTLILGTFKTFLKEERRADLHALTQTGMRNTSRLLSLINDLLDLAKSDSGRLTPVKQCVDLAAVVRQVAANFESHENRRRVHQEGLDQIVPAQVDARHVKNVVYNLLSNAFKFTDPENGKVWVRLRATDDQVELQVEDNGIGIRPDEVNRVFDRFFQVEAGDARRYPGTGIGLALVKEVVTQHDGAVSVKSHVGEGSIFTVSLPRGNISDMAPLHIQDEESQLATHVLTSAAQTEMKNLTCLSHERAPLLLVVDDNPDLCGYLQQVLSARYRVAIAKDGAEALAQAKTLRPDLILTDVMMPRMSGPDLLKAVREDQALCSTPVIFITARAGTEARIESLDAGADDYLAKPFDENELLARVDNLIRARNQQRELAKLQKEKMARFLPSHLADMIISEDREDFLRGHRTEITAVFVDLRGFTTFSETADPEDLMTVLRQYQAEIGPLISQYNGTLERFAGDALMIFFNDPLPVPNHAEQAARMAIAIRQRVAVLQAKWSKRGIDLGIGIGIATGYATLGVIGFEGRKDYAAIGPVTNLAARLCQEAKDGQILATGRFLELVETLVRTEPLGDLSLKGFHRRVSAHNIREMNG